MCSTVIAQAVIEGRYGTSKLAAPPYHNHFGLKCGKAWLQAGKPAVNMKTKEEYQVGVLTSIDDYFRVFADDKSGVAGYYDFISTPRYTGGAPNYEAGNLKTATNYRDYAERLKLDGYATSSSYVKTLCTTVEQYNLTKWDTPTGVVVLTTPTTNPQPIENMDIPIVPSVKNTTLVNIYYQPNQTYTLQTDLYVRRTPGGDKIKYDDMPSKDNLTADSKGFAIMKHGSKIICTHVHIGTTSMWLRTSVGYVCAINTKDIYIK